MILDGVERSILRRIRTKSKVRCERVGCTYEGETEHDSDVSVGIFLNEGWGYTRGRVVCPNHNPKNDI